MYNTDIDGYAIVSIVWRRWRDMGHGTILGFGEIIYASHHYHQVAKRNTHNNAFITIYIHIFRA